MIGLLGAIAQGELVQSRCQIPLVAGKLEGRAALVDLGQTIERIVLICYKITRGIVGADRPGQLLAIADTIIDDLSGTTVTVGKAVGAPGGVIADAEITGSCARLQQPARQIIAVTDRARGLTLGCLARDPVERVIAVGDG